MARTVVSGHKVLLFVEAKRAFGDFAQSFPQTQFVQFVVYHLCSSASICGLFHDVMKNKKASTFVEACGVGRDRTGDTRIFSPLLYRLSYRTIPETHHLGKWKPILRFCASGLQI
jgi:hypothetical protein